MVIRILLVGVGGAAGAVLRYLVSGWVQDASGSVSFPFGTLSVNLIGCLVIGAIAELSDTWGVISPEVRLFVVVGILGGFTTYSAFGNETMSLIRGRETVYSFLYVSGHLFLGVGCVWLGRALIQWMGR
jgi:fluoride exporter